MRRDPLLLTALLWLLAACGRSWGQAAAEPPEWTARRDVVERSLAERNAVERWPVRAAAAALAPEARVQETEPLKPADQLQWRPREEPYDRVAQLPARVGDSPFAPSVAPPVLSAGPSQMQVPSGGFSEGGSPYWTTPGYWQPNPLMSGVPGEPDCPPGLMPAPFYGHGPGYGGGYGYPQPCPPVVMPPLVPIQPPPQPMPPQSPALAVTPQSSNVPLLPPNLFGSLFGAQPQTLGLSFDHAFHTRGSIISGSPGSPAAVLAFERNGGFPDDFTSLPGTGRDVSGDGLTDTFNMAEPLPPNEVPTTPGPGYRYDGGTVSYTNSSGPTTAQDGTFQDNEFWFAQYSFSKDLEIPAAGALSVRRMYVAQNNSPIPRNRVFFDFRFFNQARPNFGDVYWYTAGLEKTFNRQQGSIEARLPFARTLDNEVFEGDAASFSTEFGNVNFTLKHILWGNERWLLSGGTGVSLPTGADTRVFLADGTEVLVIDNDAVHLQPFVAALWLPEEHFFVESFVSADIDTRGNNVRGNVLGGRLPSIGEYRSASVLMADLAAGYWIYTNPSFRAAMQGLAVIGELSYQTSLESTDSVSGNGLTIAGSSASVDMLSTVLGLHAYLFNQVALSGGVGLPLTSGDKKEYDLSAIFMANWHF
jgi:hypothetical protein